jgi:hypothetical protein
MTKKKLVTLLRQPWFYILCVELLLIFVLLPLNDNPQWLYSLLPAAWYDEWEEFAAVSMERCLSISALFLFFLAGILSVYQLLYRIIEKKGKAGMIILYLFLALFALPAVLPKIGCAREKAKRISCRSNLKQIYLALEQYALDYNSFLPPNLKTLSDADYLNDRGIYHCPSRKRPNEEFSDYLYYGAGRKLKKANPFILVTDRDKNHPGKYYNSIMSDGQLISMKTKEIK